MKTLAPGAPARKETPAGPALSWGFCGVRFQLYSGLPEMRTAASQLFSAWVSRQPEVSLHEWTLDTAGERFRISEKDGDELSAAKTTHGALLNLETHAVNTLLTDPLARPSLHASLVLLPDGTGLAFLGRCESGKSTLALWLWHHRNLPLLCDDVLLLDDRPGWVHAVPRRISVRTPSRSLLGENCWSRILTSPHLAPTSEGFVFHPTGFEDQSRLVRLRATFLLERHEGTALPGTAIPVPAADAILALAPYSSARDRGMGAAFRAASLVADSVPVFELGRAEPPHMAEAIDSLLAPGGPLS